MKKLLYIIALLLAIIANSQEKENTITVIGETDKNLVDENYVVLIALQQVLVYEGSAEVEATSLKVVKQNVIKKLKDLDIDFNRFKRNTYYEFSMAYSQNRESAYYFLKTSNKEEVRKILNLKSAGMSIANIEVETTALTDQDLVDLSVKAIANARERATAIAGKMNKSIGEIVSITDQNTNSQYLQSYGTTTLQPHSVTVTFELN
ncbi:SIMPL domain-containing protein [Nonlabens sp. Asnod2-A12]|uniref:SIMPL domain-containing protein n=1 Tax=Nonlabens sp. Asnod2-A12 TaxID=3160578 RepID=UPI00386E0EC3